MDIDLAAWSRTFLFLIFFCTLCAASILHYEEDDAAKIAIEEKNIHSHLKVFSPSLPYSYVMRLINGNLLRLNESKQGWEYSIAYKHEKIDELTYDFWIRDDVRFQDGTPLDAGLVVKNVNHFIKGVFTFTNAHNALKYAEASEINIFIQQNGNQLAIKISDNGKGFDFQKEKNKSFGLQNIQSRITAINATINLETAIEKGTVYTIQIEL